VPGFPPRARIAAIAVGTASVVSVLAGLMTACDAGHGGSMATPVPTGEPTVTDDETPEPSNDGTGEPSTGVTAPPTSDAPRDPRQEELDRQRRMLRAGTIAYRAPDPMRVGESQRVTVRVTDGATPPSASDLPGTGRPTVDPALVGPDVKAALTGPDFDIDRVGDDDGRRVLVTGGHAEWAWDVRPRRGGHLRLEVTLYVLLSDGSSPIEVRTYDRSVEVDVDAWREVGGWLREWLPYTGLTVPVVVAGIWALVRRRRTTKKKARGGRGPAGPVARRPSPRRRRTQSRAARERAQTRK
jgi:hypothetical protein